MGNNHHFSLRLLLAVLLGTTLWQNNSNAQNAHSSSGRIDLAGKWGFQIDAFDEGIPEKWFNENLSTGFIHLPGSMATNNKGNEVDVNTPWTGDIVDSSYFTKEAYAPYRKKGNIKIPFWLQPNRYYKGAAWYSKQITIPARFNKQHIQLFLERCHWETMLWVDGKEIGMRNSLATPHVYDLSAVLTPGIHHLSIRIDNRIKDLNVGANAHSITDHTQTNWNGIVGKIYLESSPQVYINAVQLFPDIKNNLVLVRLQLINHSGMVFTGNIQLAANLKNNKAEKISALIQKIALKSDSNLIEISYPMGKQPLLWSEFRPNVYNMHIAIKRNRENVMETNTLFGMRKFATQGRHFTINDSITFLRGTLECAITPKTGYPATDTAAWMRIFRIAKSYGLNHLRFHSWCPPEAAFIAADFSGFYLQIECDAWAWGVAIGDSTPLDKYIYDESERIVQFYGNHPSFCLLLYGNEPEGKNQVQYLTQFVNYWKAKDKRRLYTTAAGWPIINESDYNNIPEPRIQLWGDGLKSIINSKPPSCDYDWEKIITKWDKPTISHEIGQWCVYPDFKEIKKYTGILKANNFEIFQETLTKNGMKNLADSFLLASGKLQTLCYKADIEAALRTAGLGGFQLLGLQDFPGQGTALVGAVNSFWEDKGYTNAQEYSRFCNAIVPLARLKKMIYKNNEDLSAQIQVANFSGTELNESINWNIKNTKGILLFKGQFKKTKIPLGNSFIAGEFKQSLSSVKKAGRFILTVSVALHENSWDFFVYPANLEDEQTDILVTQQLDAGAIDVLNNGGKVLLTMKQGTLKADKGGNIQIGFSSIFWNTSWTGGQPPVSLGILCDPRHPAFKEFPTQYHSNFQWQDAMSHSNAIRLDSIVPGIQPILRVIDDWITARPLGLLFECRIGKGKLLVSGIDLISDTDKRPEAKQLLYSLKSYMAGDKFSPSYLGDKSKIMGLF